MNQPQKIRSKAAQLAVAACISRSDRLFALARARAEIAVLDSFAPGVIASVLRGENPVFIRPEDMEHLLDGLRLAGRSE
jgi:hypothetical protein